MGVVEVDSTAEVEAVSMVEAEVVVVSEAALRLFPHRTFRPPQ